MKNRILMRIKVPFYWFCLITKVITAPLRLFFVGKADATIEPIELKEGTEVTIGRKKHSSIQIKDKKIGRKQVPWG